MSWKKFAGEYLGFSRRDRVAVMGLLVLVLGIYFLPQVIPGHAVSPSTPDSALIKSISNLETTENPDSRRKDDNEDFKHSAYPNDRKENSWQKSRGELFAFDPNTISVTDWKKLGLREKTIGTILNYLAKGGKFRRQEDLKKVYGLFEDEYDRLQPYIRIANGQYAPDSYREGNEQHESDKRENGQVEYAKQKNYKSYKDFTIYDINSTDTTELIALPGIGSKLALRIINFRDKLGGFYSVEQVSETFGLADSTFQKIRSFLKIGNTSIRKININKITLDELKVHPYIRYAVAGPVIAYRNEHGAYKKVEDLKNVMAVTDEVYNKIAKYLIVE